MKIHLVDSVEQENLFAEQAGDFFSSIPGPWKFLPRKEKAGKVKTHIDLDFEADKQTEVSEVCNYQMEMEYIPVMNWDDIFARIKSYRKEHKIPKDEFVLVFTSNRNEYNWFGMFDPSGVNNGFVQTSHWDELVNTESIYPILYETIAIPLLYRMFAGSKSLAQLGAFVHAKPRGCIHDFCVNREEIIIKLQTGNICQDCYNKAVAEGLTEAELDYIDEALDSIRRHFREFDIRRKKRKPHPVKLSHAGRKIYIGDSILKLRPLDKTLYLFFLNTTKSLRTAELDDYENQLLELYKNLYSGGSRTEMIRNAGRLARNEDGLTNQAVSRINSAIDKLVIPELANHYKIMTDKDGYKKVIAEVES